MGVPLSRLYRDYMGVYIGLRHRDPGLRCSKDRGNLEC